MGSWEPTKRNTQLIRQVTFLTEIKLIYYLTSTTLKSNSLIKNICTFFQRDITVQRQLSIGLLGTQALYFLQSLLLNNARKLRFNVFLRFHARKHITKLYLKWTEFRRNCDLCSNYGCLGTQTKYGKNSQFLVNFENLCYTNNNKYN